ncbi:hypothetical protein LCGC14_0813750 [marine sediment metagenome]|uniref:Uncharacterized protein n=1 Tax=marine sediment metagenome TaxID=412755 RepID=A0A0F9STD8_9ZZZZ
MALGRSERLEKRKRLRELEAQYEEALSPDSDLKTEPIRQAMAELRLQFKDPRCGWCGGRGWTRILSYAGNAKDLIACRTCRGTGRVNRRGPRRKK